MSSDESVIGSEDDSDAERTGGTNKKFIKHELPWRSSEYQKYLESLDRKISRSWTERG